MTVPPTLAGPATGPSAAPDPAPAPAVPPAATAGGTTDRRDWSDPAAVAVGAGTATASVDAIEDGGEADDLIVLRPEGLYCPAGNFFIDPWRPVARAVITHAHADHARGGHGHYLAAQAGATVLRARLGDIALQTLRWGERVSHGGVRLSLHPAGHVLGSAQVRLEHRGRVWVVSGDYKTTPDPTCTPFEPQRCDVFITESTFGLPVYRWRPDAELFDAINRWWAQNAACGRASLLACYSFGKAQRILAGVDPGIGPIVVHPAVQAINRAYAAAGVVLPATQTAGDGGARAVREPARGALLLCPPAAVAGAWARGWGECADAFASGWMRLRGARRRGGWDRGFALSDHADWPGLLAAISATGADRIIVTHGQAAPLIRHLRTRGLRAGAFRTEYGGEADDAAAGAVTMPVPPGPNP